MSNPTNTNTPLITLSKIENQAGPDLLGYVVNWRLMNIRVQEPDLKTALERAGFSSHLPALPTPRKALRRALEAWIAERTQQQAGTPQPVTTNASDEDDENQKETTLIRVINKAGAEHLVFGIVSENVDFNKLGLSYGTQLRILLHKKTGAILCTTEADGVISAQNESTQVTTEIIPYYNEFRHLYFTDDLSKMVHAIVTSMNAVSLRKEGGVYFVPQAERHQIELAKELIASLPTSAFHHQPYLLAIPVINSESAKADVALAIHHGFLDELKALAADLDRFAQAEPGSVRSETISNRLIQYQYVKEKVGMYATLLSMQQDDIVRGLEALTNKAREIVLGKPASENVSPASQETSSNNPLANTSLPDFPNNETIFPPAAASQATTPMLF